MTAESCIFANKIQTTCLFLTSRWKNWSEIQSRRRFQCSRNRFRLSMEISTLSVAYSGTNKTTRIRCCGIASLSILDCRWFSRKRWKLLALALLWPSCTSASSSRLEDSRRQMTRRWSVKRSTHRQTTGSDFTRYPTPSQTRQPWSWMTRKYILCPASRQTHRTLDSWWFLSLTAAPKAI